MAKERKQKTKNNNNLKLPTFKLLNKKKKKTTTFADEHLSNSQDIHSTLLHMIL